MKRYVLLDKQYWIQRGKTAWYLKVKGCISIERIHKLFGSRMSAPARWLFISCTGTSNILNIIHKFNQGGFSHGSYCHSNITVTKCMHMYYIIFSHYRWCLTCVIPVERAIEASQRLVDIRHIMGRKSFPAPHVTNNFMRKESWTSIHIPTTQRRTISAMNVVKRSSKCQA